MRVPAMPTRRQILAALAASPLAAPSLAAARERDDPKRPNVLFIAIDDLSPRINGFGDVHAVTPNLDRLIKRGTTFTRAYCQQAVCGPSRASQLTGCRPDTTGVNQNHEYTADFIEGFSQDHATVPTHFANSGYHVRLGGKVHHQAQYHIEGATGRQLPLPRGHWSDYHLPENEAQRVESDGKDSPIFESPDVDDDAYTDGFLAAEAAGVLRDHAASGDNRPLFLGVGFRKPHLPYTCPRRYYDLYDPEALPLAAAPRQPAGTPDWTTASFELAAIYEHHYTLDTPVTDDVARRLRHGYYACTSYVDACVGTLLDALDDSGLAGETIVVLWSDHGFHLGDNGMWGKHVNYEVATRVPLVFAGPGVPENRKVDAVTEMLGVYPTLCDLAGVARPKHELAGQSLVPQMNGEGDPGQVAYSQYPRGVRTGHAVRTPRWRYVEWRVKETGAIELRELYDHDADPHETTNVAADHPQAVAELSGLLVPIFGEAGA